ncbi:hypothetical protein BGZ54_008209, partial [Gamsiella multidivaricata]
CARFGQDLPNLNVKVAFETESRIRIKIVDANATRYEIPREALPPTEETVRKVEKRGYAFEYKENPFTFLVKRVQDGEVVFDSNVAGVDSLVFEDEYLEISSVIPKEANIYGLGEVMSSFRRDPKGTRQTLWARDAPTPKDQNLYGSHPFYMEMRNGSTHGVFLRNSNGMDVFVTPGKVTYKVIGGVLDFTVFVGPTPAEVMDQYTEVIGRPHMPPAWAMGFHQSRYGYKNVEAVEQVVQQYRQENLPLDGVWIDIDYMDQYRDFTFDETRYPQAKVRALAENLKASNQSMILIVDPGIPIAPGYEPYDSGMQEDVFIKTLTGKPIEGRVWPGQTYFPDFFNTNETWQYWQRQLGKTEEALGVNVYPWIDMNEPSNFCSGPCNKDAPNALKRKREDAAPQQSLKYAINNAGRQAPLDEKTLAENAVHKNGLRLTDTHNLYGHMEAAATHQALLKLQPDRRPFILTRSSFAGTGAYAAHWTGDNWSDWDHLKYSISGILSFGLFGIPFVGADICGFNGNTTEELCLRWHQLGSLYPFARNHNDIHATDQEPYMWPNSVLPATRQALGMRYSLLPYFYTLHQRSHRTGRPIWQPLWFEFPKDPVSWKVEEQFLLGDNVLVSPALTKGQIQVKAFFPGDGQWFDFSTLQAVMGTGAGGKDGRYAYLSAKAESDPIPMSVRGGSVIPIQAPAQSTVAATRMQPVSLIVALDVAGTAAGEMYVDDGASVQNEYNAMVSFQMDPQGQKLMSKAVLQWPGGNQGGGDLKGMDPAQVDAFRREVQHSDRIGKIVVVGLNFAAKPSQTDRSSSKNKDRDQKQRHWELRAQGKHGLHRRDVVDHGVSGRVHTREGSGERWTKQASFKRRSLASASASEHRQTTAQVPLLEGRNSTTTMPAAINEARLTVLDINGARIPFGDGLNGGLNGTEGKDPATGVSWKVDQAVGSLTVEGLGIDLFSEWYIQWGLA